MDSNQRTRNTIKIKAMPDSTYLNKPACVGAMQQRPADAEAGQVHDGAVPEG